MGRGTEELNSESGGIRWRTGNRINGVLEAAWAETERGWRRARDTEGETESQKQPGEATGGGTEHLDVQLWAELAPVLCTAHVLKTLPFERQGRIIRFSVWRRQSGVLLADSRGARVR